MPDPTHIPLTQSASGTFDVLGTPRQRQEIWATIAALLIRDGRFRLARRALDYAGLDDPPREWPEGLPALPSVAWPKRALGWLLWKVLPNG